MASQKRLGDLLVEMKFIEEGQLKKALEEQRRTGRRLGKVLIDSGLITESRLVRALSRQLGIEICAPLTAAIHPRVKQLIPADIALRFHVLPVALSREGTGQTLFVATADPLDTAALETIRGRIGAQVRVRWMLAGETEIELALARHYATDPPSSVEAPSHFPPTSKTPSPRQVDRPSSAPAMSVLETSADLEVVPIAGTLPPRDFRPATEKRANGLKPVPTPARPVLADDLTDSGRLEEPIPLSDEHLLPLLEEASIEAAIEAAIEPPLEPPAPPAPSAPPAPPVPTAPAEPIAAQGRAPTALSSIPNDPTLPASSRTGPPVIVFGGGPVPSSQPNRPIANASWGDLLDSLPIDDPAPVAAEQGDAVTTRPVPSDKEPDAGFELPIEDATLLDASAAPEIPKKERSPTIDLRPPPADQEIKVEEPLEGTDAEDAPRIEDALEASAGIASETSMDTLAEDRATAATARIVSADAPPKEEAPWTKAMEEAAREALSVDVLPPIEDNAGASEAAWLGAAAALVEAAAEDLPEANPALVPEPSLDIEPPVELKRSATPVDAPPATLEMKRDDGSRQRTTVAEDAQRVREALQDYIRGRPLDRQTEIFATRAVVAVLVSEGLLEDGRLERALERWRKGDLE